MLNYSILCCPIRVILIFPESAFKDLHVDVR
jgi:hypothetical protein